MRFRTPYYGQKDREFDLEVGDLFKYVVIDGRIGVGLLVRTEEEVRGHETVPVLNVLTDRGVERISVSLIFRAERL